MTSLSGGRFHSTTKIATLLGAAPLLAIAGEAVAHETGAPHGALEHLTLYAGVAAFLAIAGAFIGRSALRRAEKRVRVEDTDRRRSQTRR